ncbi:MAG: MSHA biogenesis protein MshK [Noviherbaspirillum sp.]
MDEPVRWPRIMTAGRLAVFMLFHMVASVVMATDVADPTRPPAIFGNAGEGEAANSAPVLQSVIISPGRRLAIINGKTVKVGDKYGDAQVVKITESDAVLRTGKDLQTLKLFPTIEKKISPRRAENSSAGRAH